MHNYLDITQSSYKRIKQHIRKTPVLESLYLSKTFNSQVILKCENFQHTGSFKVRGAFNKVLSLNNVNNLVFVTCSGGNHGLAVAYVANSFDAKAIIVVPSFVPQFRIDMIKSLGAEVIVYGETMDDLNYKVAEIIVAPHYIYLHPFDDDMVIAGQSTVAYELLEEHPDIEVIITSIGGGGLISGISQYAKAYNPKIQVIGVQTEGASSMYQSIKANKIIDIKSIKSIATSLGATKVAERTYNIVKNHVDDIVIVNDNLTINYLIKALNHDKILIEPASSCCFAAMEKLSELKGKKIGVICCGGNFSMEQLNAILQ